MFFWYLIGKTQCYKVGDLLTSQMIRKFQHIIQQLQAYESQHNLSIVLYEAYNDLYSLRDALQSYER